MNVSGSKLFLIRQRCDDFICFFEVFHLTFLPRFVMVLFIFYATSCLASPDFDEIDANLLIINVDFSRESYRIRLVVNRRTLLNCGLSFFSLEEQFFPRSIGFI